MVIAALYIGRTVSGDTPRLVGWAAVAVAAVVTILVYARQR